jgi:chitodextrinase
MDTFVVRIRESQQSDPAVRGVVDEIASGARTTFHNHEELLMILTGKTPDGVTHHAGSTATPTGKQKRNSRLIRKCAVALAIALGAVLLLAGVAGADPTQIDTSTVGPDAYTDTTTPPVALGADAGLDRYLLYYDGPQGAGSEWVVDETAGTATDIAESNYLTADTADATFEQGTGAMSSDGNKIAWDFTAYNENDGMDVAAYKNGTWTKESLPGQMLFDGRNPLVTAIAFSANGDLMAVSGEDLAPMSNTIYQASGVYLYDLVHNTVQEVTTPQPGVVPVSLALSSDGSRLMIAQGGNCSSVGQYDDPAYESANGTVAVDSINSSDVVSSLWSSTSGNNVYTDCGGAALSADGNIVAFSGINPSTTGPAVVIGDIANNTEHLTDETVPGPARGFQLSQNGSVVSYEAIADDGFLHPPTAVYSSPTASGSVGSDISDPADLEDCFLVDMASTGLESAFDCDDVALDGEGVFVASGSGASGGPAFPTDATLQASAVTTSGVTLSWPAAIGPNGVSAYSLTENGSGITPPSANATSIQVTGLSPATTYHFALTAGDSDGNVSAPISVNVTTATPAPLPSNITPVATSIGALAAASLTPATVSADLASIGVSCAGATDTTCDLSISLALSETLQGGKVVAITAKSKPKTKKRTVILGTTTVTVAGGSNETVSVKLNAAAHKLLSHYHHLKVALTATDSTSNTVLVKQVLTFKQPAH